MTPTQRAAALRLAEAKLAACMASRDALRDWAQECRDQVLYLLAQRDDELGRTADGLGQASVGLLRELLAEPVQEPALRPPTPSGWSDTDWIKHLECLPPIGYAVRDSLYGTSKTGVLRFCPITESGAFAVYAAPQQQRKPLTHQQLLTWWNATTGSQQERVIQYGQFIERCHGIGGSDE